MADYKIGQTGTYTDGTKVVWDGKNWVAAEGWKPPQQLQGDYNADGTISTVEDIRASGQSGLRKGTGGMLGMGDTVLGAAGAAQDWLTEKMFGIDIGPRERGPSGTEIVDDAFDKAASAIGMHSVRSDYDPKTTAGEYTQTAAEFLPGAAIPGGGSLVTRLGAAGVSGLASEGAGQLAEAVAPQNEGLQTAARIGGALLGPTLAQRGANALTQPPQRGTDAVQRAAKKLEGQGVRLTAGQATNNPKQIAREMSTDVGQELMEQSHQTFTDVAIKRAMQPLKEIDGLSDDVDRIITRGGDAGERVHDSLEYTKRLMDKLADENILVPTQNLLDDIDDIIASQSRTVNSSSKTPLFKSIKEMMKSGAPIDGAQYQNIRTELRAIAEGGGPDAKLASRMFSALTDAMTAQLKRNGQHETVKMYEGARDAFKRLSTIADAFGRGNSIQHRAISPQVLGSAAKTRYGKDTAMLTDKGSPFSDLVIAGRKAMPQVGQSGTMENTLSQVGNIAGPSSAATAGGLLGGAPGAAAGGAGALLFPGIRNRFLASPTGQRYMRGGFDYRAPGGLRGEFSTLPNRLRAVSKPWWDDEDTEKGSK